MEVSGGVFANSVGGRKRLWDLYKKRMATANFDPQAPMFVASGLVEGGLAHPMDLGRLMFYGSDIVCNKVRSGRCGQCKRQ
jgi:hypothetical protein